MCWREVCKGVLKKGVVEIGKCWRKELQRSVGEECCTEEGCQLVQQHDSCVPFVMEDLATGSAWHSCFFVLSFHVNSTFVWLPFSFDGCVCHEKAVAADAFLAAAATRADRKKRAAGVWLGGQIRLPCIQPRIETNMGLKLQCSLHQSKHSKAKTSTKVPNVKTKEATPKEYAFHVVKHNVSELTGQRATPANPLLSVFRPRVHQTVRPCVNNVIARAPKKRCVDMLQEANNNHHSGHVCNIST